MKNLFVLGIVLSIFSCNQATEKTTDASHESKMAEAPAITNMSGYTPTYSSEMKLGNSKYAENVMALFRTWDSGDLTKANDYFADSVSLYLRDGMLVSGTKDQVMAAMQQARSNYTAMENRIHVVFPVTLEPSKDEWACIWSTEKFTDKAGKTDSLVISETWRFNTAGKVDLMYQYGRSLPSKPVAFTK